MFVLDASVAAAWLFSEEANTYTESVLDRLGQSGAVAPDIWPLEMANILLVAERRGRLTEAQSIHLVAFLNDLPITVIASSSVASISSLLSTGRQHNLSSYDASYLELAMREGLPLATQDKRLRVAAESAGVPLIS